MTKVGWQRTFSLNLVSKQLDRWHKTGHFAVQGSARAQNASRWHVCSSFMFPFYLTPKNLCWGNLIIRWIFFYRLLSITLRTSSANIWQKCVKCFYSENAYWILIGKYLGRGFFGGAKVQVKGQRSQVTGHNKKYSLIYGEFQFGSYLFISY